MHTRNSLPLLLGFVACLPAASARPATTSSGVIADSARVEKPTPKVSLADARRTALARVPGEVLEAELEREGGRWVYSFEIRPSAPSPTLKEVHVDADTGERVAVEDEVEGDDRDSADDYD